MLDKFERYPLTFGPTPIEKLGRLTIWHGRALSPAAVLLREWPGGTAAKKGTLENRACARRAYRIAQKRKMPVVVTDCLARVPYVAGPASDHHDRGVA